VSLTDLPILDVAIGLSFFFFLLSIIASSVSEIIASVVRMRAKNLEAGIRTLLGSQAAANSFFEHWRIKSLGTPKWWFNKDKDKVSRKPSYIPARTFSLAVLDTFSPGVGKRVAEGDPAQVRALDVLAELHAMVAKIDNDVAKKRLGDALDHARGNVDAFRLNLEDAFNDVMDRATGWYKRKVQVILFIVALAVAGGLNADTLNVADRLARDDAVRAQVVAQAQAAVEAGNTESDKTPTTADVEKQIEKARATALPLGWSGENVQEGKLGWVILLKAAGILMTAVAMLLGAPFWFDTLGKFARLRSTGNRIGTPKDDETAPVDRDDRLRRSAPAGSAPPPPLSDAGRRGRG
jgi:hypothetical protein